MGHQSSKLPNDSQSMKDWTILTSSEIEYICQHTNLIDKEVRRRQAQFLQISSNGKMEIEEFTSVLQSIWPSGNVRKLSNYLFHLHDKDRKGFLEFKQFIILHYHLNNDKSYFAFLFDMCDTRGKGSLSRVETEVLFASLFELIGYPTREQCGGDISQQQITHLIQLVDASESKRLSRDQFINIRNTNWTDSDNGVGVLLAEHTC